MSTFNYRNGVLYAEDIPAKSLAEKYGTPLYVYSANSFREIYRNYTSASKTALVCYSVKSCSSIGVLSLMASLGSGFDIVSGGELQRALRAGADPHKIVYSGVGKTVAEMELALKAGILCFNVESEPELETLSRTAGRLGLRAPFSIRVNPNVDAKTHPYISTGLKKNKFGIPVERAEALYEKAAKDPNLEAVGIDCHIGSQLLDLKPFSDAADKVLEVVDRLKDKGITLRHLDMGGGLGVNYIDEVPPAASDYISLLSGKAATRGLSLIVEPGRSFSAPSGILLGKVLYLKHGADREFAITDTAMNDLIRPSLYQAEMKIEEAELEKGLEKKTYDVVGPVCETGDFLGRGRELAVREGSVIAVTGAGAYGFSMSSNYNSRPRAAEVMVDGDREILIRKRETFEDLIRNEAEVSWTEKA